MTLAMIVIVYALMTTCVGLLVASVIYAGIGMRFNDDESIDLAIRIFRWLDCVAAPAMGLAAIVACGVMLSDQLSTLAAVVRYLWIV